MWSTRYQFVFVINTYVPLKEQTCLAKNQVKGKKNEIIYK